MVCVERRGGTSKLSPISQRHTDRSVPNMGLLILAENKFAECLESNRHCTFSTI